MDTQTRSKSTGAVDMLWTDAAFGDCQTRRCRQVEVAPLADRLDRDPNAGLLLPDQLTPKPSGLARIEPKLGGDERSMNRLVIQELGRTGGSRWS